MAFYSSASESSEDEGVEDYRKGGYHAVRVGDDFAGGRYVAQRKLGWGCFSTVWLAYDTQCARFVALKIQKSAKEYAQAAAHEIEILAAIAEGDPSNSKCILRLLDHFKHSGPNGQHLCLVFELLGDSLLKLIRYNHDKGIGLSNVKSICKSVLVALDYLHRELGIIHTDLKPENVVLVSTINPVKDPVRSKFTPILERPEANAHDGLLANVFQRKPSMKARRCLVKVPRRRASMVGLIECNRSLEGVDMRCKLVDFGNACWSDKQLIDVIQTRQYRAPEVILGSGYSFSADMWSLACLVFELATGDLLFAPKSSQGFSEDEDHLALMMELLGKIPRKIAIGGCRSKDFFNRFGDLKRKRRLKPYPLDRLLTEKYKFSASDSLSFVEFLKPLFDITPEKRPTAAECLLHPWLNK